MIIWPDADVAGLEYARAVARYVAAAGAMSLAIVSPPEGVAVGWEPPTRSRRVGTSNVPTKLIAGAKSKANGRRG